MEAGLSGEIFDYPEPVQEYLISSWLETTWAACQRTDIKICRPPSPFKPCRANDMEIMQAFLQQVSSNA